MSRNPLPDYVIIFGKEIPVIVKEMSDDLEGDTNGEVIWINEEVPVRKRKGVLIHEMVHCAVRRNGQYYRDDHDTQAEEMYSHIAEVIITENFHLRRKH
jgi:hypothetical protein